MEELARNIDWAAQDPAVAEVLRDLIAGVRPPDAYLRSDVFVPGAAGGTWPRFTEDAPADPLSRAGAVLGSLAALGGTAIRDIAALAGPDAPVYGAGGWARSAGWTAIKQAVTGIAVTAIAEPEVTAVGAALLAANALGHEVDAAAALTPGAVPALPNR